MQNEAVLPAELHNQRPAKIEAVLQYWPDMARYAETARLETVYDAQRQCWRACVTVTVFNQSEETNNG